MDQQLRVEQRGRVLWLTIDRGERRKQLETLPFEQSAAFAESQIGLFALTDDAREGQLAFRDKRRPQWTGR